MNSLFPLDDAQLGGVHQVYFVEHRQLVNLPDPVNGTVTAAIELMNGSTFASLAGTIYTPALDAEASDTQHGQAYKQTAAGFFAGDDPTVSQRFANMNGKRYLVLLRYFNGSVVAVGDNLTGLTFSAKFGTGKQPKESKGTVWKFEAITSTPARYLGAPFFVEGIGLVTPNLPLPAVQEGAPVEVWTESGRFLGYAQPGGRVTIRGPFKAFVVIT